MGVTFLQACRRDAYEPATLLIGDTEQRFVDVDVEAAYARAVLAMLESVG